MRGELAKLELPSRRVRWGIYGERKAIAWHPGFPSEIVGKTFDMTVHLNGLVHQAPARATETVLVAMLRAGLVAPSVCRSGECGFCRSLLMEGDVWVVPESDGRRGADRTYGFVHPCSAYPLSDLELKVPPGTAEQPAPQRSRRRVSGPSTRGCPYHNRWRFASSMDGGE